MAMQLSAYADVGKTGLGNMLFPWARAKVFCKQTGARMLYVHWTKLDRIGPWLRREPDKRYYFRLFDNSANVGMLSTACRMMTSQKVGEVEEDQVPALLEKARREGTRSLTVVFEGIRGRFREILPHKAFVRESLMSIIHRRLAPKLVNPWGKFIGVHVRRADFIKLPPNEPIPKGKWNYQIPDEWYLGCIAAIRQVLGQDYPIVLFSNGQPDELTSFTKLKNLTLAESSEAIVDIVRMSHASVFIGSGSSFSQWAEFIGGMPSVWYPADWQQFLMPENPAAECEADIQGNPPASFVQVLSKLA